MGGIRGHRAEACSRSGRALPLIDARIAAVASLEGVSMDRRTLGAGSQISSSVDIPRGPDPCPGSPSE